MVLAMVTVGGMAVVVGVGCVTLGGGVVVRFSPAVPEAVVELLLCWVCELVVVPEVLLELFPEVLPEVFTTNPGAVW
jgi:hypothetical protein